MENQIKYVVAVTVGVPKFWSMSEIADFRVDSHGFKCVEFENDICFAI